MDHTDRRHRAVHRSRRPRPLRARKNLFIQFGRFLAINLKMLKIIRKEHR